MLPFRLTLCAAFLKGDEAIDQRDADDSILGIDHFIRGPRRGQQHCFHAPGEKSDFLGWRIGRKGRTEIVYENCNATRFVWRADFEGNADLRLDEALSLSVNAGHERVIATLFEELKKRAIAIELI